jgi:hypothetical protein
MQKKFFWLFKITDFFKNAQLQSLRSMGFHPRRWGSPCDNPRNGNAIPGKVLQLQERYYVIIALNAGAVRGDRHGPFLHRAGAFSFHSLTKRNSPGPKGARRKSGII